MNLMRIEERIVNLDNVSEIICQRDDRGYVVDVTMYFTNYSFADDVPNSTKFHGGKATKVWKWLCSVSTDIER